MKTTLGLLVLILIVVPTFAQGTKKVAKSNRSLWPYKISSTREFDFASKMEMLVFAGAFQSYSELPLDSVKKKFNVESISPTIATWKDNVRKVIIVNFSALGNTLPHDVVVLRTRPGWEDIIAASAELKRTAPENLKAWYANAAEFYDQYVYEQMRLAAIFTRTTSEILTLQPSEISGSEYKDKQFLLTFDDGPTAAGGHTDKLITTLESNHVNGIFFVVGDVLQARIKLNSVEKVKALYSSMAVGSHGKMHKAHPKYEEWQTSITFTDDLIQTITAGNGTKYFRPPYGQRNDKIVTFLKERNTRVMLWNIDSQDWNANITAKEVADRVTTLMLLWRRGVILFHDIHPKAGVALPVIWEGFKNSGVKWVNALTPCLRRSGYAQAGPAPLPCRERGECHAFEMCTALSFISSQLIISKA